MKVPCYLSVLVVAVLYGPDLYAKFHNFDVTQLIPTAYAVRVTRHV